MAYINTKILKQHNLNLQQVALLQILHQNKTEDVSELLESYNGDLDVLNEKGLLSEVKARNKQESVYKRLRLSKKGSELLDYINTPDITEGDIKMYEYLVDNYIYIIDKNTGEKTVRDVDRKIGNRKNVLRYCAEFRQIVGLSLKEMYWLCMLFIDNTTYTKVLEYIFMRKKDNPYGKFKNNLDNSALYQFWLDNNEGILEYFKKVIKED